MSDLDATCAEERFDLVAEILAAFDFLINEYGFRVAEIQPTWPNWVRYESKKTFVWVGDERMHYDLEISVSLRKSIFRPETVGYSLHRILEAADAPVPRELWNFQTSSDSVARKFLYRMAAYLKEYGQPALLGATAFFEKMDELSRELSAKIEIEDFHRWAQEAWERRDYRKASELYAAIAQHLSPAEDKKSLYCIRKLKETGQG